MASLHIGEAHVSRMAAAGQGRVAVTGNRTALTAFHLRHMAFATRRGSGGRRFRGAPEMRRLLRPAFAALVGAAIPFAVIPATAHAQVAIGISVNFAPPPLPVYDQPPIPGPGFLWVPGYWAWSDDIGYYWVPGTWVQPPAPELLWTPGYWGFDGGIYAFHAG